MTLMLRPYQHAAIDAVYKYFQSASGHPLIVLPTGTGKSFVIAQFLKDAIAKWPKTRIIIATHVKELVQQDYLELLKLWPDAPAGVLSAGLGQRSFHHQILFCSIQTAYKYASKLQHCDLLIPDEAHTIPHAAEGMWRKFITDLQRVNPKMKVLGLTATDWRMDGGLLTKGDNRIFTDVAYRYGILDAVKDGFLCEIVPRPVETHLTVSGVHKRGGDYVPGELERAVDVGEKTMAAVREIVALGANRKSWLVFGAGVKHCSHIVEAFKVMDIDAAIVTAETPQGERDSTIAAFKAGRLRCLVGMNVFTTGFNMPALDLIACLRPTGSAGLWVQMVGRGMRTAPGKTDCLLLDFSHNIDRFGPLDKIRGKEPGTKGNGEAPQKICEKCHCYAFAGAKFCPDCGFAFPPVDLEKKLNHKASDGPVLSTQAAVKWIDVKRWDAELHYKFNKPESLHVHYNGMMATPHEYVCFGHDGYARDRAVKWWGIHNGRLPAPNSAREALERLEELTMPSQIAVQKAGKYSEIVGRKI